MPTKVGNYNIGEIHCAQTEAGELYHGSNIVFSTTSGIRYIFKDVDDEGALSKPTGNLPDASKITIIGENGLYNAFNGCTGITGPVSFPNLRTIGTKGLSGTFQNCTGITSALFPALTSVGDYGMMNTFSKCTGITTVSFPKLVTINKDGLYNTFTNCSSITSVSLPALVTVGELGLGAAFMGCTSITGAIYFPSLTNIGSSGIGSCFRNCTGITQVHFRKCLSGHAQCTASYLGCANATVYFDLA